VPATRNAPALLVAGTVLDVAAAVSDLLTAPDGGRTGTDRPGRAGPVVAARRNSALAPLRARAGRGGWR
jgi:hypothetical protein